MRTAELCVRTFCTFRGELSSLRRTVTRRRTAPTPRRTPRGDLGGGCDLIALSSLREHGDRGQRTEINERELPSASEPSAPFPPPPLSLHEPGRFQGNRGGEEGRGESGVSGWESRAWDHNVRAVNELPDPGISGSTPAASTTFASRSWCVAGRLGFDRQPTVAALGTTPARPSATRHRFARLR